MLTAKNLTSVYTTGSSMFTRGRELAALENVSLEIPSNTVLGLVGESGCGKSTLGKTLLRLIPPKHGEIRYKDVELTKLSQKEMLPYRKKLQIIFQDPYSSLNPKMTVSEIVGEGVVTHFKTKKVETDHIVNETLKKVNLSPEAKHRYPHEFSGGQRQRIAIARSLALEPEFIVCDEAVSALDVSTQAQILNLLLDLKEEKKLSYLFISHDLSAIRFLCDNIAVMYLGKIVELGLKREISENPFHPYTKALFDSAFTIKGRKIRKPPLAGEIPGAFDKPQGCHFHPRCPIAETICRMETPKWKVTPSGRGILCHVV